MTVLTGAAQIPPEQIERIEILVRPIARAKPDGLPTTATRNLRFSFGYELTERSARQSCKPRRRLGFCA